MAPICGVVLVGHSASPSTPSWRRKGRVSLLRSPTPEAIPSRDNSRARGKLLTGEGGSNQARNGYRSGVHYIDGHGASMARPLLRRGHLKAAGTMNPSAPQLQGSIEITGSQAVGTPGSAAIFWESSSSVTPPSSGRFAQRLKSGGTLTSGTFAKILRAGTPTHEMEQGGIHGRSILDPPPTATPQPAPAQAQTASKVLGAGMGGTGMMMGANVASTKPGARLITVPTPHLVSSEEAACEGSLEAIGTAATTPTLSPACHPLESI